MPPEFQYIWNWFWQLDQTRQSSGFGGLPITYTEVAAWANLMGQQPRPWEVEALTTLDAARRAAMQPPEVDGSDANGRRMVSTSDWRAARDAFDRMTAAREPPK